MNRDAHALRTLKCGCLLTAVFWAVCSSAYAQDVTACDTDTALDSVLSPKGENIRLYANGNVIIAVVDDGRADVGSALSVLVVSPPYDVNGERQCRMISVNDKLGYAALLLDKAEAAYDPAIGLTVHLPGVVWPTDDSLGQKIDLSVTINQQTGVITPKQSGFME